jgi:UDP-N-acetylmuramate: L-alanyl-gamma-D-glutamyl-meso-diaminopimelate ligase
MEEKGLQRIDKDNGESWHASAMTSDGSRFTVILDDTAQGTVEWALLGVHNVDNALTAIAAARHAGVPTDVAIEALGQFKGVKRRLELFAEKDGLRCYDDFAHHPSAIRTTLQGLRNHVGSERIVAIIEPRTHTMSLGTLREDLYHCTAPADEVIWFRSENIQWDLTDLVNASLTTASVENDVDRLVDRIDKYVGENCHVVIMSNGGFGGIYQKITQRLSR